MLFAKTAQTLYALAPASGTILWEFCPYGPVGETLYSAPVLDGCHLFIGDCMGWLHCLDVETGRTIWKQQASDGPNPNVNATATVAAGLLIGNVAVQPHFKAFSSHEREFVQGFWEFAAFIANSLIFLLIGVTVAQVPLLGLGFKALSTAVGLVLLGRLLTVYPLCLAFARSRRAIPLKDQHVLWWGGLRGALALALALSLPESLPFAYEIRIVTFGVVIFSVLFQGLTMPLLLRKTGHG
jgi:hypothetical protein